MQYVDYKEFENNHKAYLSISDVDKNGMEYYWFCESYCAFGCC
jgi:hypothetical protein